MVNAAITIALVSVCHICHCRMVDPSIKVHGVCQVFLLGNLEKNTTSYACFQPKHKFKDKKRTLCRGVLARDTPEV